MGEGEAKTRVLNEERIGRHQHKYSSIESRHVI